MCCSTLDGSADGLAKLRDLLAGRKRRQHEREVLLLGNQPAGAPAAPAAAGPAGDPPGVAYTL